MGASLRRISVGIATVGLVVTLGCGDDATAPNLPTLTAIAVGLLHSCALGTNGTAFCWGWNRDGQLGDGTRDDRSVPVQVRSGDVSFETVAAGGGHTCGIGSDGVTYCWGFNLNGQLGDGSNNTRTGVAAISGGTEFVEIALGASYSCGVTAAQEAYCWGWNGVGQLGDGSQTDRNTPVEVSGNLAIVQISAGTTHTCAVTAAGEAFCWGENSSGQLGDGTSTDRLTPTLVTGGHTFQSVQVGFSHTCGVTTVGDVLCWGSNSTGQLGNGGAQGRQDPGPVDGTITFTELSAQGGNYNCGIDDANAAHCWGFNNAGQLGAQSSSICTDPASQLEAACSLTPVAVSGGLSFRSISAGTQHSCGLTTNNVAYCWGLGNRGQLGNGQRGEDVLSVQPVRVSGQS